MLFLSGNKYKPKKALKAMMEHIQFQLTFLPIPFEKVEALVVSTLFTSEKRLLLPLWSRLPLQAHSRLWCHQNRSQRLRSQSQGHLLCAWRNEANCVHSRASWVLEFDLWSWRHGFELNSHYFAKKRTQKNFTQLRWKALQTLDCKRSFQCLHVMENCICLFGWRDCQ